MNSKILVTYASQAGSTRGIAEAIGQTLTENGAQVEVRSMKDVKDVSSYQAVVAGSAIHGGKLLDEANNFIRTHRTNLTHRPFFAFYVCMALSMKNDQYKEGTSQYLEPFRRVVHPVSECGFSGAVDFSKLPMFPDRLVIKGIVSSGAWTAGDHRDWKAVHNWAEDIASRLS